MPRRSRITLSLSRSTLALLGLAVPAALAPQLHSAPVANAAAIDTDTATAVYLLNFVRFTEWPAAAQPTTPTAPYVIGVSGSRPLLDALIRLVEGQQVRGHPVYIVRLKDVDDLARCHLAYLSPTPDSDGMGVPVPAALAALRGKPVLTISPTENFIAQGGMVELFRADVLLRFDIAATIACDAGLALNSRLLALARPVPVRP